MGTGAFLPTSAPGVYLTAGHVEAVIDGLRSALPTLADPEVTRSMRTPPVIARSTIEKAGYFESFPHLLGHVSTLADANAVTGSDLVLLPAGCYCVYPMFEGVRLTGPTELSIEATCFRQETTTETGRLRSFRMHEFVHLGTAAQCRAWRDTFLARAGDWVAELGLTAEKVVASDPFFGGARLLRMLQVEEELKIELATAVGPGQTQAIASGNCHKDHFGRIFAISDHEGAVAHSACVAFGYERLALALLHHHGEDPAHWPERIRRTLSLEASQ
jgi:seryl-tRNA synthetase